MKRFPDFLLNIVTRWQVGEEYFGRQTHCYTEQEARVARKRAALTPLEKLVQ